MLFFCAKRLITLQPRVERLFLHLQGSKKYVPVKINPRNHSYIVLIQPQREHHRWHIFGCRYLLHWSLWATAMTSHGHTLLCSRYVTAQVTAVFSWTIGVATQLKPPYQRWYRRRGGQTRIKEIAEFWGFFQHFVYKIFPSSCNNSCIIFELLYFYIIKMLAKTNTIVHQITKIERCTSSTLVLICITKEVSTQ